MRRTSFLALLALLCLLDVSAQEKLVATASPDGRLVEVSHTGNSPLPAGFVRSTREVSLYSRLFRLRSRQPLPAGQTFVLKISSFTDAGGDVTVRFVVPPPAPPLSSRAAEIAPSDDATKQSSRLQVRSKFDIDVAPTVKVHRIFYRVSDDEKTIEKDTDEFDAEVERISSRRYLLKLDSKLLEGITVARTKEAVRAEGKVKVAGIPAKPEELRLDFNGASNAAVHQKPVFELGIKYNTSKPLNEIEWLWEPSATVDVGLRSTKSANSVILTPLNFSNVFFENRTWFGPCEPRPDTAPTLRGAPAGPKPNAYSEWLRTPWYCPSDVKFTFGPKAEFDRNFKRKNVLGCASSSISSGGSLRLVRGGNSSSRALGVSRRTSRTTCASTTAYTLYRSSRSTSGATLTTRRSRKRSALRR